MTFLQIIFYLVFSKFNSCKLWDSIEYFNSKNGSALQNYKNKV